MRVREWVIVRGVEIRLTHHAGERMAENGIVVELVRQCCLDPDRVYSKRLTGGDRFGLAFVRDFERGTLEAVGLQRGHQLVVITAYWLVPGSRPPQPRTRRR